MRQGDAFFVRSGSFSALIDGGRSWAALSKLLAKRQRRRLIDVVACTHNDADHAGGLIGLLDSRKIKVSEVWLPGQWTTRLQDLLVAPEAFMYEVLLRIEDLGDEARESSLGGLAQDYEETATGLAEGPPIVDVLDEAVEARSGRLVRPLRHLAAGWSPWWHPFRGVPSRLFTEAIDASDRIRQLAYLAWERAVAVRWFDAQFAPIATQTKPLRPVNAREIARVPRDKPDALRFLALSVSNKRSLCFEFRSTSSASAALLTGDSDLTFKAPISWTEGMIVTAPHHGAEANASAYQRARQEALFLESMLWVRSDGRFRSRPGATFLHQVHRYCTRCRPYSRGEQAVCFTERAGRWSTKGLRPCGCAEC